MNTIEALGIVRDALQPTADRPPLINLQGGRPDFYYAEKEMAFVERRLERLRQGGFTNGELQEAWLLGDYLNEEIGPVVELERTVEGRLWRQTVVPHVHKNLGRIGIASDRAASMEILQLHTVDIADYVTRATAELLVTTAMVGMVSHDIPSIGVYASPENIAELRKQHPDMSAALFRNILHGMKLKLGMLPAVLEAADREEVPAKHFERWLRSTQDRLKREEVAHIMDPCKER